MDATPGNPVTATPPDDLVAVARLQATRAVAQRTAQGNALWTAVLVGYAALCTLTGHPDAIVFALLALPFVNASTWDARDRALTGDPVADAVLLPNAFGRFMRGLSTTLVPGLSAVAFLLAGLALPGSGFGAHLREAANACLAAAVVCALAMVPAVQVRLAGWVVRGATPGHVARLTVTMGLVVLLLPYPASLLMPEIMSRIEASGQQLLAPAALIVQLVGELLLAVISVGAFIVRDRFETRHLLVAGVGLALVWGVNAGMEWLERTRFPALYAADQRMVSLMASGLGIGAVIVLGLCAGIGEEVLVRGALQPRVGLVVASLLFACVHVQYTWFGILTVGLLGVALGIIRARSNTTVAIVVHSLYDVLAALQAN
jgi:membrane protease YdiL (CAAX protease family)